MEVTVRKVIELLLIALLLLSNSGGAQEEKVARVVLGPELRHAIFVEASRLSEYAIPEKLPEICLVSHRFIVEETCEGIECSRYAAAAPHKPIYIDETLDLERAEDYSYVLHEVIHVLQFAAKGITDLDSLSCNEILQLEREAYHLQQKYLSKERAFLRVTWMIDRMRCS